MASDDEDPTMASSSSWLPLARSALGRVALPTAPAYLLEEHDEEQAARPDLRMDNGEDDFVGVVKAEPVPAVSDLHLVRGFERANLSDLELATLSLVNAADLETRLLRQRREFRKKMHPSLCAAWEADDVLADTVAEVSLHQARLAASFLDISAALRIRTLLLKGKDGSWKALQHKLGQVSHQGTQLCLPTRTWSARHASAWMGPLLADVSFSDREDYYTLLAIVRSSAPDSADEDDLDDLPQRSEGGLASQGHRERAVGRHGGAAVTRKLAAPLWGRGGRRKRR